MPITSIPRRRYILILPEEVSAVDQGPPAARLVCFQGSRPRPALRRIGNGDGSLIRVQISVVHDIGGDNVLSNTHHIQVQHNIRTRNRIVYTELSKRISEAESPIS